MQKNVQIPVNSFKQLIKLCEEMKEAILINGIRFDYYSDLEDMLSMLYSKQTSLERRQAYGKFIAANKSGDEVKQTEARIEYLQRRGPKR
ncbi:MAG: hypothetical protein LBE35_02985 [Clostridiales bacterium]|jgi:hypothetical protein|nr:hypothetical protein [Clostridiales bacterium]